MCLHLSSNQLRASTTTVWSVTAHLLGGTQSSCWWQACVTVLMVVWCLVLLLVRCASFLVGSVPGAWLQYSCDSLVFGQLKNSGPAETN